MLEYPIMNAPRGDGFPFGLADPRHEGGVVVLPGAEEQRERHGPGRK